MFPCFKLYSPSLLRWPGNKIGGKDACIFLESEVKIVENYDDFFLISYSENKYISYYYDPSQNRKMKLIIITQSG